MIWKTRQRSDFGHGLSGFQIGTGPQIVLIHGVGLRAEAWIAICDRLADRFTLTCIDMPGHGGSEPVTGPVLALYSERIAALLADLGPCVVAGHSMGAMISLDLVARYPQRIRGVGAMNAVFQRSDDAAAAVQRRARSLSENGRPDPRPTLERWFGTDETAERAACHDWLSTVDLSGYATAYTTFATNDGPSVDALVQMDCPALFLTGALDPNSTPEMSQEMARLCPNGTVQIVPDAAHMLPMTHPETASAALDQLARTTYGL